MKLISRSCILLQLPLLQLLLLQLTHSSSPPCPTSVHHPLTSPCAVYLANNHPANPPPLRPFRHPPLSLEHHRSRRRHAPAIPVALSQHLAQPPSGLNTMGVYTTNFNETPYCCPWNPKTFEVLPRAGASCL